MKGTAYLQGALAFLPGQLWLVLCIGVLFALAVTLVVVSIVFGGHRRRSNNASRTAPLEQPGERLGQ
jgi:hypothetical protein